MENARRPDAGTLFVVGTPIGNLGDLGDRAREVLGRVDLVAAEDTRRTRRLLSHISVRTRLIAYHEHNEPDATEQVVAHLLSGESVALVTDAGTPLISDPGLRLVARARAADIPVVAVPGASAITAALSVSGLPTDRFVFEGFLPRQTGARDRRLAELARETRTLVFFEAVHRLAESVAAMARVIGTDRAGLIHRELTKVHEASYAGTLGSLAARVGDDIPLRGEFVIVIAGAARAASPADAEIERVYKLVVDVVGARKAVSLTAAITGASRNAVYRVTRSQARSAPAPCADE
jgi:16S rRNA (cytidine1402-2'-O)-methyltransferase